MYTVSIASAQFVCLLLFSVGSVQLSVAFSVSTVSVAFRVCTDQWVMLRLYSLVSAVFKSTGCSPRVCHVHTWIVLCPCAVLEF